MVGVMLLALGRSQSVSISKGHISVPRALKAYFTTAQSQLPHQLHVAIRLTKRISFICPVERRRLVLSTIQNIVTGAARIKRQI